MVLGLLKEVFINRDLYINVICLGSTATFFLWFLEKKTTFLSPLLKGGLLQLATFSKASFIFLGNLPTFFEQQAHTSSRVPNTAPSKVN